MRPKINLLFMGLIMLLITPMSNAQNGLHFDGVNDYILTNYTGISGTNSRTVEAWIKCPLNTTQKVITCWGNSVTGGRFTMNLIGGKARIEVGGNGVTGTTVVADNNWHHLAVTFNNSLTSKFSLYVDGVLESSFNLTVSTNTSSSGNFRIGSRFDGANKFVGYIDEVRVWNYAKTVAQIIADTGRLICLPRTGLVAYHSLDHGTAGGSNSGITISADSSGSANDGTLTGFSLTGSTSNWVTGKQLTTCYPLCYGPSQTLVECDGYTITVNGNTYSTTGVYSDTLVGVGCDSVIVTDLTIKPLATFTQTFVECTGYFVTVGTNTYTTTGVYLDTLVAASSLGCDSIVTTDLTVGSYKTTNQTLSECNGFTIAVGINTYSTTGIYNDTLIGAATGGCDSIVNTDLTIFNHSSATDVIVACDSYTWNGVTYMASNSNALDTLVNANGCDSIVTLNLTINYSTTATDVHAACDSYTWINGMNYTSSNSTVTHTLLNAIGCDSVVTLNLTITNSTTSTDVQSACGSYSWINGITYYASNSTAKDTVVNSAGCDSIITLNLTINPIYATTDVQTVCDSLTWADGVTYYSNNTTATYYTTSVSGCDSAATLNLTIINSTVFIDAVQACGSYTWINGVTYTASNNTATEILVSSNGCDSIVMLDQTLGIATSGSDIVSACDSLTWINGITYYSNNINTYYTIPNASGCDSIVRLFLSIVAVDVSTSSNWESISANATGFIYQWIDCSDDSPIAGETNRSYIATANGSYKVEITDGTCSGTSECVTLINVGINEAELIGISVYPNPTSDVLNIDKGTNASLEITITNSAGASVHQSISQNQITTIKMSKMATGMYIVTLKNEQGVKVEKVVKR
ncbi:MAG: hypothetical protein ACI9GM_000549 [Salibacteraceae bacterium]|jgi:hypothetical protein